MSKNLQIRSALFLIAILVVPFTFYFAYQNYTIGFNGFSTFSSTFDYVSADSITFLAAGAYLFVFFALIVKKNVNLRVFLIYISALFELMMILDLSKTFLGQGFSILNTFKGVFYRSPDVAPLQLFNSMALILWTVLIYQERQWFIAKVRNLLSAFKSNGEVERKRFEPMKNAFASIIVLISIAVAVFQGTNSYKSYSDAAKLYEVGFNVELFFIAINLILTIPVVILFALIPLLFLFDTRKIWLSEFHTLSSSLTDFKLSTYITRVVSGYLYWFYTVIVVATLALTAPMLTVVTYLSTAAGLETGFKPQLALIIVGIPALSLAIGYIVVLLIRIVFELAVALVHIAENSRVRN